MKKKIPQLLIFVLHFFILSNSLKGFGQPQDIKDAIFSISKITGSSSTDNTDLLLEKTGFKIPKSLSSSWDNFPAYRKIETAYWSAESNKRGKKFIALLAKNLSKEFESIPYEKPLKKFLNLNVSPQEKLFVSSLTSLDLPPTVPPDIASSIVSIVKYTDAKALGGTTSILKYYFNLSDDVVYDILRKSATNYDALLSGIEKASVPPSQKERLKKIVTDLRENFESANFDKKLEEIIEKPEFIKAKSGEVLKQKPPKEKLKLVYETFVNKTHPTKKSKMFIKMKKNPKGWGGVIFGNKVISETNIPKLKTLIWIHNQSNKEFNPIGSLEFFFNDSLVKTMQGVLWEDVYAAYNIVYLDNKSSLFDDGTGIGLAGATYPDVYNEDKIYDSIIRSNNLSTNEIEYYLNRCKSKKEFNEVNNKFDSDISPLNKKIDSLSNKLNTDIIKLNELSLKILKNRDSLKKQLDVIEIAKERGNINIYNSSLKKGKQINYQLSNDKASYRVYLDKYKEDSTNYSKYSAVYEKEFNDIKDKYLINYEPLREKYDLEDSLWKIKDSTAMKNIDLYLSNCNKVVLYPIIANLELGRSLIRADVLPRNAPILIEMLKSKGANDIEIELSKKWLEGSDTIGWKFTDDSLLISFDEDFIQVNRQSHYNNKDIELGLLNFNRIDSKNRQSISTDFIEFNKLVPLLTKTFYDYYRLNNFAKLLAVFRWSKQNGAKFLNKPKTPPLYKAPLYTILRKDGSVELVDMK
jgi:hypothetical protein